MDDATAGPSTVKIKQEENEDKKPISENKRPNEEPEKYKVLIKIHIQTIINFLWSKTERPVYYKDW